MSGAVSRAASVRRGMFPVPQLLETAYARAFTLVNPQPSTFRPKP